MKRDGGFPVTRKREARRRCLPPPLWVWLLALAVLLLAVGITRAWPQSSGSSSSSSSGDLKTWEALSGRFRTALDAQSMNLEQALTEVETSRVNLRQLTSLLEQSLKANESLKSYNAQIAERMQERDEELARAYSEIDRLEKLVLRMTAAFVIAACAAVVLLLLLILTRRR